MRYLFPATKWAKAETSLAAQVEKISEEYKELRNTDSGSNEEVEELFDLIQACETYLRILKARGVNVNAAFKRVKRKNKIRGYYNG